MTHSGNSDNDICLLCKHPIEPWEPRYKGRHIGCAREWKRLFYRARRNGGLRSDEDVIRAEFTDLARIIERLVTIPGGRMRAAFGVKTEQVENLLILCDIGLRHIPWGRDGEK